MQLVHAQDLSALGPKGHYGHGIQGQQTVTQSSATKNAKSQSSSGHVLGIRLEPKKKKCPKPPGRDVEFGERDVAALTDCFYWRLRSRWRWTTTEPDLERGDGAARGHWAHYLSPDLDCSWQSPDRTMNVSPSPARCCLSMLAAGERPGGRSKQCSDEQQSHSALSGLLAASEAQSGFSGIQRQN